MKFRILTLLVLLTILVGLAGCGGNSTPAPSAADTTESAGVTLVPYTSEEFGISGVVPDGWVDMKPGQFHRGVPGSDPTFLGQVTFPGATMEQVIGTMGLPGPVGGMTTADLTWDLHTVEIEWGEAGTIVAASLPVFETMTVSMPYCASQKRAVLEKIRSFQD